MKNTGLALSLAALALIIIILATGCGNGNAAEPTTAPTEPTIPERFLEKNSLFLILGDEITVDGVTYTASTLYENDYGVWLDEDGYFVVNRVNGAVFFICHYGSRGSQSATEYAIDTGVRYTGTIKIGDTAFEVPVVKEGVE
jgi:hypothetical protein